MRTCIASPALLRVPCCRRTGQLHRGVHVSFPEALLSPPPVPPEARLKWDAHARDAPSTSLLLLVSYRSASSHGAAVRRESPVFLFPPSLQASAASLERTCHRDVTDVAADLKDTLGRMLTAVPASGSESSSGGGGGGGGKADAAAAAASVAAEAADALCTITLNAVVRGKDCSLGVRRSSLRHVFPRLVSLRRSDAPLPLKRHLASQILPRQELVDDTSAQPRRVGVGLFQTLAFFNHSCRPNCTYTVRAPARPAEAPAAERGEGSAAYVEVTALRAIAPGEELSITYCDPFQGRWQRRRELWVRAAGAPRRAFSSPRLPLPAIRDDGPRDA